MIETIEFLDLETLAFLDILFFNVATPIVLSAVAIWMVTDMRRMGLTRLLGKIYIRARGKNKM